MSEDSLLRDPSISYWLKTQIVESKGRDILDSIRDAELLLSVLNRRFDNMGGIVIDLSNEGDANG